MLVGLGISLADVARGSTPPESNPFGPGGPDPIAMARALAMGNPLGIFLPVAMSIVMGIAGPHGPPTSFEFRRSTIRDLLNRGQLDALVGIRALWPHLASLVESEKVPERAAAVAGVVRDPEGGYKLRPGPATVDMVKAAWDQIEPKRSFLSDEMAAALRTATDQLRWNWDFAGVKVVALLANVNPGALPLRIVHEFADGYADFPQVIGPRLKAFLALPQPMQEAAGPKWWPGTDYTPFLRPFSAAPGPPSSPQPRPLGPAAPAPVRPMAFAPLAPAPQPGPADPPAHAAVALGIGALLFALL